ncbi:hypothetical protein TWF281_011537 [Arthrobotrys megalospora]
MSTEAPKPADPNPPTDKEEAEAEAEEDLEKQEFATWLPYIASKGVESKQILYTLAKKKTDVTAGAAPVIENPYFIAVRGEDLYRGFCAKNVPTPMDFVETGVYFVSMAELASCTGKLKSGKNKTTGIMPDGIPANPTDLEILDIDGTYIKVTVGFNKTAYKRFWEMAVKPWKIFSSAEAQKEYLEKEAAKGDKAEDVGAIFCGPNAGFQPLNITRGSDDRKAFDAYLAADAAKGKYLDNVFYSSSNSSTPNYDHPALGLTWFKRVAVKSRYANPETLAKEDGLYVRLNTADFKLSTLDVGHGQKNPNRCYIEKGHFMSIWAKTDFSGEEIVGVSKKRGPETDIEDLEKGKESDPEGSSSKPSESTKKETKRSWVTDVGAAGDVAARDIVPEIYFRDEVGKVWAKTPSDGQKVKNFMRYYEKGTTRPDYGKGRFPRAVDMAILKIWINQLIDDDQRYGGTAAAPREKLYDIFERAHSNGNMKTEFKFFPKGTKTESIDPAKYTLLSRSCFGDYDTYIETPLLTQYLAPDVTDERQVPKDVDTEIIAKVAVKHAKGIQTLASFNKIEGKNPAEYKDHTARETRITAAKIDGAYGTRASALNQGAVMEGISATDVANALGWSAMRGTSIRGWEKERFSMAEWLHRCGYAYGGLADNDPQSSQVKENLIFGSSETNSIMTRYEDVYRNAIIRERTLVEELKAIYTKAKLPNPDAQYVNGRLATALTDKGGKLFFKDNVYTRETIAVPKAKEVPGAKDWADIGKRYPWLSSELTYKFSLDKESKMFKNDSQWTTRFFPFDRLFFTRLEAVVDDTICLRLWEFAILDAKTTVDKILGEAKEKKIIIIKKVKKEDAEMEEKEKEDNMDEGK